MAEYAFVLPEALLGEIGWIGAENLDPFRSLLLPECVAAIERGEALTALGWVVDGTACGALAGYAEEDCFVIASFYVAPAWRKLGGGEMLLEELSDLLSGESGYYRIEFSAVTEEQKELERFLARRGFALQPQERTPMYMTRLGDADRSMVGALKGDTGNVRSFEETKDFFLRKEEKRASTVFDPLPQGGFQSSVVDRELSVVYETDDEITGYIVLENRQGGLFISAALNRSGKPQVFLMLIREALYRSIQKYGEEYPLYIPVTDDTAEAIIRRLFPSAEQIMRVMEKAI